MEQVQNVRSSLQVQLMQVPMQMLVQMFLIPQRKRNAWSAYLLLLLSSTIGSNPSLRKAFLFDPNCKIALWWCTMVLKLHTAGALSKIIPNWQKHNAQLIKGQASKLSCQAICRHGRSLLLSLGAQNSIIVALLAHTDHLHFLPKRRDTLAINSGQQRHETLQVPLHQGHHLGILPVDSSGTRQTLELSLPAFPCIHSKCPWQNIGCSSILVGLKVLGIHCTRWLLVEALQA